MVLTDRSLQLSDIQADWYSLQVGDRFGITTDSDDINQCINLILGTPKRSDPHRPDFGSNLRDYVDWPTNLATPYLVQETYTAIEKWEPRILLESVAIERNYPSMEKIFIKVSWKLKNSSLVGTVDFLLG